MLLLFKSHLLQSNCVKDRSENPFSCDLRSKSQLKDCSVEPDPQGNAQKNQINLGSVTISVLHLLQVRNDFEP